jgi:uncharacterized protein (TIGR03083 family)
VTPDLGDFYRRGRLEITRLVTHEVADRPCPATPGWTVKDVMAHLTGATQDFASGNLEGAPSPTWTSAQVARLRDRTLPELREIWAEYGEKAEALLSTDAGRPLTPSVFDVQSHLADIQNALGMDINIPADVVDWVGPQLLDGFAEGVKGAGLDPVTIDTTPLEIFRSRLGRRTSHEVRSLAWSTDPEPYLTTWFIFGPAERSLAENLA